MSMLGAASGGRGDICPVFCPEQPAAFAKAVGADLASITVAIAFPSTAVAGGTGAAVVYALRSPGAERSQFVPAWKALVASGGLWRGDERRGTIAGKAGTDLRNFPMTMPGGWQFLYVTGDVLIVVADLTDDPVYASPVPVEPTTLLERVIAELP
jgi:hypothetical protein